MATILTDTQKATITATPVSARGNPARVDGIPTWTTDNPTVLGVEASADGMSATITAAGGVGDAQVQFTCDADLGEGVVPVIGLLSVTVVAGPAASVGLVASEIVEQ